MNFPFDPWITYKLRLNVKLTKNGQENELCRDMARPEFPWTEQLMLRQGQSTNTLHSASRT